MHTTAKIKLIGWLQNPRENWDAEDFASCGARGCFYDKSSDEIHRSEIQKPDYVDRKEMIFRETSGRGHGAVLDHSGFVFSLKDVSRATTLFLCSPQFTSHLQQSLRRASANRGFYLPESLRGSEAEDIMNEQFRLYEEMVQAGVPKEDARYILPLYVKTNIQSLFDARELQHLDWLADNSDVPSETRDVVKEMVSLAREIAPRLMKKRETNYEPLAWYPAAALYYSKNKTLEDIIKKHSKAPFPMLLDFPRIRMSNGAIERAIFSRDPAELANLKHIHYTFLASMSLACFHQAIRQRTWDNSVEPLKKASQRGIVKIPSSIMRTSFDEEFSLLASRAISFANNPEFYPDSLGVLPHALEIAGLIHINGWNALHSLGKRTCTQAQWEIRDLSRGFKELISCYNSDLGNRIVPQCVLYGRCPERKSCGYYSKIQRRKNE